MKGLVAILAIILLTASFFGKDSSDLERMTILFSNDIHGGIAPQKAEFLNPDFPPMLGGGASAAAIIKKVRDDAEKDGTLELLLDGGDLFQGTLVGTRSSGMAVIEYMNLVGYDATVVGNHEFDLGKDNLIELIKASDFHWLSCNIYDTETGDHWEWVKPAVIHEEKGLKIGLTGVTTVATQFMSFPDHVAGLEFRNEIVELQKQVDYLQAQNVDIVIALAHVGLAYNPRKGYEELKERTKQDAIDKGHVTSMELAHYVRGIDILVNGHIHKGYERPWEDPVNHTICLQNYGNGSNLGWIDFEIDQPTKTIAGYSSPADNGTLLLLLQDQFWPDSTVLAFLTEQQEKYEAGFREVVGEIKKGLNRSSVSEATMNNFITDVISKRVKADFSFMNFGGIRADLRAGPVTREDIFKVLPFGNEIVVFQCDGRFLKRIIETKLAGGGRGLAVSGVKVVYNRSLPDGQKVVQLTVGGEPIDPDKTYRVATNNYLMEGNSGLRLLTDIPEAQINNVGFKIGDAVVEYFEENKVVEPKLDGRWKRDDSAQPSQEWLKTFETT
ncbi:MAG: bifunctional UDP-sugar hydrolase/5'-nucleotidase [Calditrichota bacterium]